MKVDKEGNIFMFAPGGFWILSADAKLLGKIVTPGTACEYGPGR